MRAWECWPEGEERGDYETVTAIDAEDAAVEFAETYDRESGEGHADERIVFVAHVESAVVERFRVHATVSVDYRADLLGPDEP